MNRRPHTPAMHTAWPGSDNSDDYLSLFERAWRGEPSPLKCYVTYNHLAVDCFGNI